jgi:hypothetical protein
MPDAVEFEEHGPLHRAGQRALGRVAGAREDLFMHPRLAVRTQLPVRRRVTPRLREAIPR